MMGITHGCACVHVCLLGIKYGTYFSMIYLSLNCGCNCLHAAISIQLYMALNNLSVCMCVFLLSVCLRQRQLAYTARIAKVKGALSKRFYCGALQDDYNTSVKCCYSDTEVLA